MIPGAHCRALDIGLAVCQRGGLLLKISSSRTRRTLWQQLGPGLITGAADDDPSGVATYAQVGAAFGFATLWSVVFTLPLMVGIQIICARIGRVTGIGLAANIRKFYPPWLLFAMVGLLLVANVINIAADVAAMGAALALLIGGPAQVYAIGFGTVSLLLQIFIPFPRYAPLLKFLTFSLLAYVATIFVLAVPWRTVLFDTVWPSVSFETPYIVAVVAVFGTTISPYLFFWQAAQEVEEQRAAPGELPLRDAPEQAPGNLRRICLDTWVGMGFSNVIAFFIMLTAALTLHLHGINDIQTSAQAAQALRPVAGEFAFVLFACGIVGTGLLALPVLAGSAAYALSETLGLPEGLGLSITEGRGFYLVLGCATLLGMALNFTSIDPIKALFWSAVINGLSAMPMMVLIMLIATRERIMGRFVIPLHLRVLGWLATGVMASAALAMLVTW